MQLRNYSIVVLALSVLSGAPPLARAQQPANYLPFPGATDSTYETQPIVSANDAVPVNYENYTSSELVNERLAALEAELARLKLADGGSSIAPGHSDTKMKITGRVHVDSWNFPEDSAGVNEIETEDPAWSPQDRFGFRRLRFGVRGTLPANMEYRIEMEFAGGNQSEFRDAWLGWNELPLLQTLLVGNQKRPYGLDHLNSSRYNVFLERPFVIEAFNQDARRLGIASYGVSDNQRWNWRYGVYNQRLIQDEGVYVSDGLQLELAGRLANTIWYDETSGGRGYAHWALSGTWADPDGTGTSPPRATNEARFRTRPEARTTARWIDTGIIDGTEDYVMLGAEGVVNVGRMQLVGEYQNLWLDRVEGFGSQVHLHGGYFYVSYFLTGEHMPWSRKSGTLGRVKPFENFFLVDRCRHGVGRGLGAWQVAARYSYTDFNDANIWGGVGESFTLGLNWYWTPYARLQFNYIYGEIRDRDADNDESTPQPLNLVSGDYGIIGLRAMVDF
jgi:phosphate-selective porin OprO/OprP